MLYALLFTATAAGAASVPTTPIVVASPAALPPIATANPPTAPAATATPWEVRSLWKVGTAIVIGGVQGRFVPDAETEGYLVVPTTRYAQERILMDEGKRAREGDYGLPGWQKFMLAAIPVVVPVLLETYREIRKP